MISFISGTLVFLLKNDIKNYLRQFTKTLNFSFQRKTTHTVLVMCNYICLEQVNICTKYKVLSDKCICFLGKICKIYKAV